MRAADLAATRGMAARADEQKLMDSAAEITRIAQAMIAGELELIEGCRELAGYLSDAALRSDPDARTIIGVDSEADAFPIGAVRERWANEALAERDRERTEYMTRVTPIVLAACGALVAKLNRSS